MKVSMKITAASMSSFKKSLLATTQRVSLAADRGMEQTAAQAFKQTQARVPRETGAMANSGKITKQSSSSLLKRTIGYGDSTPNPRTGVATAEYTPLVHEVFNPDHPNSYKWMEQTIRSYGRDSFMHDLAASIRSTL